MTAVLYDPWSGATIHDDALPSPLVNSDANGDYIIHRENGKSTYKAYSAPSSELPEVTADDNGDVLTVVSGEWAKATPSGGGGDILFVGTTVDGEDVYLDKTWQELLTAAATKLLVIRRTGENQVIFEIIEDLYESSGTYTVETRNDSYTTETSSGYPLKEPEY